MQNLKGQMDLFTKQKQTDSERTNLWLPGARKGRRTESLRWMCTHTAVLKMDSHKDLLYSTRNCSVLCGSLDVRGVWGRLDTWICMAESFCCPPKTITTVLISCTPIQNKKLKMTVGHREDFD